MSRSTLLVAAAVLVATACLASASPFGARVVKETWGTAPTRWARGPRVQPSTPVELIFAVKQTNLEELESTLVAVSDPDSPRYGQHLSAEEVDNLVAPRPADILTVLMWLKEQGVDLEADVEATGNSGEVTIHARACPARMVGVGPAVHC